MDKDLKDKLDDIKSAADHSLWAIIFFIFFYVYACDQDRNNDKIIDQLVKTNSNLEKILSKIDTTKIYK